MSSTTHNALQLGDTAPDFIAETTAGKISLYEWMGDSWCVFFSHPKDFTPVCTTELGYAAKSKAAFDNRHVKILALSVGSVESHKAWIPDINETQMTTVNFPIVGDPEGKLAQLYGMIHPNVSETFTVRTVFIIDPKKKIRLMMTYPQSTGRNFDEILRVIDSMQLTDKYKVATPANWKKGEDCIILPSLTDPDELKLHFPKEFNTLKPYLRITPQPDHKC